MGFPFHHFTGAGFKKHAVHTKRHTQGVLFGNNRAHRVFGKQQQHGNTQNGSAKAYLNDMGGQGQTKHGAHNGAGRGNQRHGQGQAQVGKVTAQKTGPGSKRARKGHHQASTAHKVEVEGEKPAHQRHKQHAAAHASHNGDDAKNKTEEQQGHRPVPPGVIVDDRSLKHLDSGLGCGGRSLH